VTKPSYEPLSAQDRAFLVFEDRNTHMHLGGVAVFEGGPLVGRGGAVDVERIRAHVASRLHLTPRYRQRLGWVPVLGRPVWVDETHFNLEYHVRHSSVPRPGGDAELRAFVARVMSQQLDRGKPLWEMWIVEGLRGRRFALLLKTHHALADGIAAFDLFNSLLRDTADATVEPIEPWVPRPVPSGLRLVRDGVLQQVRSPLTTAQDVWQGLRDAPDLGGRVRDGVRSMLDLAGQGIRAPMTTPLNAPIGPHRRFDWLTSSLADVTTIRRALGGTVNDVVLATVAGGMRRFLRAQDVDVRAGEFRVMVPVSVRRPDERDATTNRVSGWLVTLPIGIADVEARYARIVAATTQLKRERRERGPELLVQAAEHAVPGALTLGVRIARALQPHNVVVTNVPGPQCPLYLLGARMVSGHPLVPLFVNQGIGLAIFSYDGRLCWGVNADWDRVPDVDEVVRALRASFRELLRRARARATGAPPLKHREAAGKWPSSARSSAG
jgi:diacylglycerol O-acyltransferase